MTATVPVWAVASLQNGYPFDSSDFSDDGPTPLLRIRDLSASYFGTYLPFVVSDQFMVEKGDLVVGMDGDFNAHIWTRQRAALNQRACRLRSLGANELRFIAYALPKELASINATQFATTVKHLSSDEILKCRIPKKSFEEQRRIADFLDDRVARIDQIITARRRQIAIVHEQLPSIADELLTRDFAPWARLGLFVRGIEQGWSPQCDAIPAEDGEWGVIKVGAVKPGWFQPLENKRLPDDLSPMPEYELSAGDLLVSRANTPERVGFFAVVPDGVRRGLILCDKVLRVRVDETFMPEFVALVGQSRRTRDALIIAGTGTSGSMVNIRGDDLRDLRVPLVSLARQQDLVQSWLKGRERTQEASDSLARSIRLLSEYKESLITAAVTGEVDVTTAGSGIPG